MSSGGCLGTLLGAMKLAIGIGLRQRFRDIEWRVANTEGAIDAFRQFADVAEDNKP